MCIALALLPIDKRREEESVSRASLIACASCALRCARLAACDFASVSACSSSRSSLAHSDFVRITRSAQYMPHTDMPSIKPNSGVSTDERRGAPSAVAGKVESNLGRNRGHRSLSGRRPYDTTREATNRAGAMDPNDGAPATLFDKIISKAIPADVLYEDELALAFRDINPAAPTHFLVIPKTRDGLTSLSKADPRHKEILGHLLFVAQHVAKEQGLESGFRIVINDGADGCQTVFHLHLHCLGGRQLGWPPG